MADKKPALEKITLPRGIAVFPKLTVADEYKGKSTYSTGVKYLKADVQPILDKLTALAEARFAEEKAALEAKVAEAKGAAKVKAKEKLDKLALGLPFKADVDEDGNETDYVIIKAKMNDRYKDKKGKEVFIKPALFDAGSPPKPITKKIDIWGGSEIKVSAAIVPYFVDSSNTAGVSLRLSAVQVIVLRKGGASAEQHGFGSEEDGFSGDSLEDETSEDTTSTDTSTDAPEEEDQF